MEQTSGPAKAPAEAVAKDIWPGEGSLPVPIPPPSHPSTTFSAAVRRAEKPRITKGFRPKLWTAPARYGFGKALPVRNLRAGLRAASSREHSRGREALTSK